jgi:NNP family nitrate/nitrite transporter-like MFS transporter
MWHGEFPSQLFQPLPLFSSLSLFGQDHPAGRRHGHHNIPATEIAAIQVLEDACTSVDHSSDKDSNNSGKQGKDVTLRVVDVTGREELVKSTVDIAVNQSLTWKTALRIVTSPLTWLPALVYLTTLGFELALNARMADVFYTLFDDRIDGFDQRLAGYYTCVL